MRSETLRIVRMLIIMNNICIQHNEKIILITYNINIIDFSKNNLKLHIKRYAFYGRNRKLKTLILWKFQEFIEPINTTYYEIYYQKDTEYHSYSISNTC